MARHFTVTQTSGTNSGPYTIYHSSISEANIAVLYGTSNPATNLTLTQLQNGVLVTVPDSATSLIVSNGNSAVIANCPTNIVTYPISSSPDPTNTPNPTSAPTSTPVPTDGSTPQPTSNPTATPVPTDGSTPIPTSTANPTNTPTPTSTPSATNQPTPSPTGTPEPTPDKTPIPTSTPTPTPTATGAGETLFNFYITGPQFILDNFCTTNYTATTLVRIASTTGLISGTLNKTAYQSDGTTPYQGSAGRFYFISDTSGAGSTTTQDPRYYVEIGPDGWVNNVGQLDCTGGGGGGGNQL